jgi:hypothetical protein
MHIRRTEYFMLGSHQCDHVSVEQALGSPRARDDARRFAEAEKQRKELNKEWELWELLGWYFM